MDDYLFLTMANLAADRRALERETPGMLPALELTAERASGSCSRASRRVRRVSAVTWIDSPWFESHQFESHQVMKALLALAASVAINAALIGGLNFGAQAARVLPKGEVSIVQIDSPQDVTLYAHLSGSEGGY